MYIYLYLYLNMYIHTHTCFQLKDWFSKYALWIILRNPWGLKCQDFTLWRRPLVLSYCSPISRKQGKPVSFSSFFVDSAPAINCASLSAPQVQLPQTWVSMYISHHSHSFYAESFIQGDQSKEISLRLGIPMGEF